MEGGKQVKTYGNLATVPKPKPRTRRVTRKVIRKKGLPVKEKLLYLCTVIVFVLITSWVLSQQAKMAEINYEIQKVEEQVVQMEDHITTLESKEKELLEPERIKRMARERGLVFDPSRIRSATGEEDREKEHSDNAVKDNF